MRKKKKQTGIVKLTKRLLCVAALAVFITAAIAACSFADAAAMESRSGKAILHMPAGTETPEPTAESEMPLPNPSNKPEPELSEEPELEPSYESEPEPSYEPEPEPSYEPFEPEHPYYENLYPDFYAPQKLTASNAPDGIIYLTFDDGPSMRTDEILAVLDRENIKATFFVVGQTSESNLQRMRDIIDQGHTIAMHSYSHDYVKIYASVEAFLDDMYQIFKQIQDTTGVVPTFFRFPGGSINSYDHGIYEDIMAEMLRRGFIPCDWNMSAQDATAIPLPVSDIIANVLSTSNRSRGVVLMHDSTARTTTAEALPELIRQLKALGFQFEKLTPDVKPIMFGYGSFIWE